MELDSIRKRGQSITSGAITEAATARDLLSYKGTKVFCCFSETEEFRDTKRRIAPALLLGLFGASLTFPFCQL